MLALLAALAERIESSPALPKEEAFVGETLISRSDRAVGLPRVVDMVLLVKSLEFEGVKRLRGGCGCYKKEFRDGLKVWLDCSMDAE